ncbi:unnamed protein product [Paramecium sonneborni]|uniref:Amino acid transporter transmembrane domain-containing protein n=1 Tax=Paramecium sonneborni TaxID=65129 RepID=A0A8S1Q0R7_9CILI|nr:unnamed protein product [Paramecium sonneborni]
METLMITQDNEQPKSTNFQTTIKLIKVTVGSGIFAMPYAYAQAGLWWGIILQLLVCTTQYSSWCIMVNCLGDRKRLTLIQYLSQTYGENSFIYTLAKNMSIILNFGCGLSYIILFQITIGSYFEYSLQSQIIIFVLLFIIIFGFSFAQNLQIFVPILKQVLLIVYISFAYLSFLAIIELNKWKLTESNTDKVMIAFGIMIFAYDMNGVLTEIRIEMEDTSHFQKCLFEAMTLETILFMFFGITSSLLFQTNTNQSIITNYQEQFKHNYSILITLSILMITYVSILIINTLMVNMPFYLIINSIFNKKELYQMKIIYVLTQMLIAFLYPNFAIVLSIFGCVCCVTLGYIIPYYMTFRFKVEPLNRIINTAVVLFGIFGGFYGLLGCFG